MERRKEMDENRKPGEGEIVFSVENDPEILSITPDGEFYVRGKKVTEDIEVYRAFVEFLKAAGHYKEGTENG
jgi:hypothetical protein